MFIARKAARRAYILVRGVVDEAVVDDIAQEVFTQYLELPEFNRPHKENDFEAFAVTLARRMIGRERRGILRARNFSAFDSDDGFSGQEKIDRKYAMFRNVQPEQENYVYFQDVMRALRSMPREMQRAAIALAKAEDIVGFAEDNEISLFEAMNQQKRLRDIMCRLAGDMADEKKFAESG